MYENAEELFIEIGEIISLYKCWDNQKKSTINFVDNNIIELIKHYFQDIQIADDKYIFGFSCKLLNKKESIDNFIIKNADNLNYEKYINFINSEDNNKFCLPASKSYFELYIQDKI